MRQIRESQEPFERRRAGEPAPLAQAAAAPLVPAPLIAAPIAVIGSPNSTTTFTVDILETARDRALDHAWVTFEVVEQKDDWVRIKGEHTFKRLDFKVGKKPGPDMKKGDDGVADEMTVKMQLTLKKT